MLIPMMEIIYYGYVSLCLMLTSAFLNCKCECIYRICDLISLSLGLFLFLPFVSFPVDGFSYDFSFVSTFDRAQIVCITISVSIYSYSHSCRLFCCVSSPFSLEMFLAHILIPFAVVVVVAFGLLFCFVMD